MTTLNAYRTTEREICAREARTGFRAHAIVYVVVNTALILINLLLVPQFYWFEFPLVGWGFGLLMHYWFGYHTAGQHLVARQARLTAAATSR